MTSRWLPAVVAALLVAAVLAAIAVPLRSQAAAGRLVATAGRQTPEGHQVATHAFMTGNSGQAASGGTGQVGDRTEMPTTSSGGPAAAAASTTVASTSVATPLTTRRQPGTTSEPPTSTTAPSTTTTTLARPYTGPPTGRLVVALSLSQGATGSSVGGGIATMAADGTDRHVLVSGKYASPQWTPDGRFVVFESTDAYTIWAIPTAGGPITKLADGAGAAVSPDGSRIVYSEAVPYSTAPPALAVQKVAETAAGLVATGPAVALGVSGVGPVWSPDGRRILYKRAVATQSDLGVVGSDGTSPHSLLASAPVLAQAIDRPGFSADGSTISFLGTDGVAYFVNADGSNLRPALPDTVPGITNLRGFSTAWSADHNTLAVLVDGTNSVVVVTTTGRLVAAIRLPVPGFPAAIAFDGSGHYVYFKGGTTFPMALHLYSVALDGTGSHQLDTDGSLWPPPVVLP